MGPQLTPRDVDILCWIGRHGLVTPAQITRKAFHGPWAAYRRVSKLEDLGLIRRDRTFWRAPEVIRLTGAGARVAQVGLRPAALVPARVPHALAVVDLVEQLLPTYPGAQLVTERELRAARAHQPAAGLYGRIPDAVLILPATEHVRVIAIELDRTPKRATALARVVDAYATLLSAYASVHVAPDIESVDAVWWYAPPSAAQRIRAAVTARGLDPLIRVWERRV